MSDTNASATSGAPDKPSLDGLEAKWVRRWHDQGTYTFDRTAERADVFSIDTPPPTVSGSLHVGHIFSYTHTDTLARYHRMQGKAVFYPMGWDDNGLPTERRVQNYFGVRCDPSFPYVEGYEPPGLEGKGAPGTENAGKKIKRAESISRPNFIELCERLVEEDEQVFEHLFRTVGLSVDWSLLYSTIDERSRRISQKAFLKNLERGEAYQQEAPSLWDVTFQTAVAQAELEDREQPSAYHTLKFTKPDGSELLIDTTRPELLPACVAVVAHPEDERYLPLKGQNITSPVFGVDVPMVFHELADPEKGTGVAMICTFGDLTDVTWWRELNLPARAVIGRNGRFIADAPDVMDEAAIARYSEMAGKTVHSGRQAIIEMLTETDTLVGEPRPITHPVKFFEKGDKPLEIVSSRQWYIRNGGREDDLKQDLIGRGRDIEFHPTHMRSRYINWVDGLNGDWLISRQRFFGVPIPLWYQLDEQGEPVYDQRLVPAARDLPIDPSVDVPEGFADDQRGKPGGFMGEPDVFDTWATSSLSPQIASEWDEDSSMFNRVYPFDMRPQAHDIIRTWMFATIVRSHYEEDSFPWANACLSGWILDPDRKKMSKSVGNVVTPMDQLEKFGSDAVRYWAASGRPGTDTAFDVGQMKIGRRLAIKLLNASKFALGMGDLVAALEQPVTEPLDQAMLARLATLVDECTKAFDGYDYARALERTEQFFWTFTDDYIELVKNRAYGSQGDAAAASAHAALARALDTLLRLLAPFLPFATEEVWSWWREGSIHISSWPVSEPLAADASETPAELLALAGSALGDLRRVKTEAKRNLRTVIVQAKLGQTEANIQLLNQAIKDVAEAGAVQDLQLVVSDEPTLSAELEPEADPQPTSN